MREWFIDIDLDHIGVWIPGIRRSKDMPQFQGKFVHYWDGPDI